MSSTSLQLTADEQAMLGGEAGAATATAMRLIVALADVTGAERLVEVRSAHVDGCLYHGTAGLDFAERLAAEGGRVRVPTTLNVASLDLLHPDLVRMPAEGASRARRLMDAYVAMGCAATWTCAPYQLPERPRAGDHVAWAESNAIVFVNSVLGARSGRYGDFVDICAGLVGRVPYAGLHRPEERRARLVVEVDELAPEAYLQDEFYAVLGHVVGRLAGSRVPVLTGLPPAATEDQLKAFGAAAASSGSMAMFHLVGVTPEAPTLDAALGGRPPIQSLRITPAELRAAWRELTTAQPGAVLGAVSLGTPHFSVSEFERLTPLLRQVTLHPRVSFYISTNRAALAQLERRGWLDLYRQPPVRLVTDTCTYVTPIIDGSVGVVMTNSAKWAWYAPANLGISVAFGTIADCLRSAVEGRVVRELPDWLAD